MSRFQLFVVLALLCLVFHAATLPNHYNDLHYYYGDTGSSLMAARLMDSGATPWLDFNYYYGFATLWVNQAWYNMFGYTPWSNHLLNMLCRVLLAWGTADLMCSLGWNRSKPLLGLVLLSSPVLFCFLWFTTAHTMESALVIFSLSMAVKRRFSSALFLATLALLFKPALAYFLGLFLILLMFISNDASGWRHRTWMVAKQILPSLLLLIAYSGYVCIVWGWRVCLHSLFPLSAMQGYGELSHGFFTQGSLFWFPRYGDVPRMLEHYLLTPAGLWVAGTLYLLHHTALGCIRWATTRTASPQQICLVLCGMLHLMFILVLFGNEWSWLYEPYLLIFGVAAALSQRVQISGYFLPVLMVLTACSLVPMVQNSAQSWKEMRSFTDRHFLFMTAEHHEELEQIEAMAKQHVLLFVTRQGAPAVLLGVRGVPTWSYLRLPARDWERLALHKQMTSAEIMVFPKYYVHMIEWPDVAEHLKGFLLRRITPDFQYWLKPSAVHALPDLKPQHE